MFAIYLGHMGNAAGRAYPFVYMFHVPLFFFLAGCTEALQVAVPFFSGIIRAAKKILVPWLVFCVLTVIVALLTGECRTADLPGRLKIIALGTTRNRFVGGALWFLTCLFVVKVLFSALRFLPSKVWIAVGSLIIFSFALWAFDINRPVLPYNIDSALYYLLFYTAGYLLLPLNRALSVKKKLFRPAAAGCACLCLIYGGFAFWGHDPLQMIYDIALLGSVARVVSALVLIGLVLAVSKLLEPVSFLRRAGQESLYLCGGEYIVKALMGAGAGLFGLQLSPSTLLGSILYCCAAMALCFLFFLPLGKRLLQRTGASAAG